MGKGAKIPSSSTPQALRQLRVGSSTLGIAIPIVYGENRIASNLIDGDWFTAIPHSTPAAKKSGGMSTFVQYTYTISAILALAEGVLEENINEPCSYPQQVMAVGRATPGLQVITVADDTGKKRQAQPTAGWAPAVWKTKKVRRVVPDPGDGIDPNDGDDTHAIMAFRPVRFHSWETDNATPRPDRFISGIEPQTGRYDPMYLAFQDKHSPNPTEGIQPQRTTYKTDKNENYPGIAVMARQNIRLGGNASMPNFNIPLRGLMQYVSIYATTALSASAAGGDTTLHVRSTSALATIGTVLIDEEQITYTGKTSTTLTGCTRGANGTPVGGHASGERVIGYIHAASLLTANINNSVTTIPVKSTANFPTSGTVLIDAEQITYTGITPTSLTGATRGANTTTAVSHLKNARVQNFVASSLVFIYGADPACIWMDLLTNPKHGGGWDDGPHHDVTVYQNALAGFPFPWGARADPNGDWPNVGDPVMPPDSWSAYCRAQNILMAPIYDAQTALTDILKELADYTNTAIVWSEGLLKMIPKGTTAIASADTGVTYVPTNDPDATTTGTNLAIRFNLGIDDLKMNDSGDSITVQRRSITPTYQTDYASAGYYNHVQVEFLNAANGYAVEIAEAQDEGAIASVGLITHEPYQAHEITSEQLAKDLAERLLGQLSVIRATYKFRLDWRYSLLEPMDYVTLTDLDAGLDHVTVRVTAITEAENGDLDFEAEDTPSDFQGGAIPVEPPNPPNQVDAGGVSGGGMNSAAPVDGIYPPPGVVAPGTAPGALYLSIDNAQDPGSSTYLQDAAVPIPRDITLTALAVRPYFLDIFTATATTPFGLRYRFVVVDPDGVITSRPEIEVRFDRAEIQWIADQANPLVRQQVVSSKLATGTIPVAAGSLVCIEVTTTDQYGNSADDAFGVQFGAANFTATAGWEPA